MAKIYILLFKLIFIPNRAEYCTCAPLPHWKKATPKEYEYADDVIIADVIIDENEIGYKITVCEVFKGDLKTGQILNGKNFGTCGPYVDKDGEWVLFGANTTYFKVNDCGLSSNIAEPRELLPPLPPPNSGIDYDKLIEKRRKEARENIKKQIQMLRRISNAD
ncbi:hypothetical protein [Nonlabens sp. SY33080]|uniref:hypothetical protein n=1 Tax=Nonlabens sp. SY33080 TaxID=2719911 RepID=UPI00142894B6|nr:hypothetical protein [Nonlabens sp. SY33080]